jgi:DnaK suppressor protein
VSKTPAKKAPPKKATPSKPAPAAKKAAKPAAKATSAKAAPAKATPAKKVAAPAAAPKAAPAKAPVVAKAVPTPAPRPAPVVATRAPSPKPSKYATPVPPPAPLPAATSRFADRFAPPRPPTRQMNNLGLDTPKPVQKSDPKLLNAWKSKSGRDLTEAEVLAMPDSEYMNDKQLEFFRFKLQTLKDDLLSNAGETTEHLREDTSIVPDPADRATIEEEHALELRTRDRERKLLKKISQSLARIDAGDYGFCDETGEPIGLGRLIARPTATLSLEAQQRRELKQKMFGD